MTKTNVLLPLALAATGLAATPALAQENWAGMDRDTLRGQVQQRYDAALAATLDPAYFNANDPRYIWASEAKAQCGIALGYLKSNTRDEVSLSKCWMAYDRMMQVPQPRVVPAPEPTPAPVCNRELPGLIFFEFDSATPGSDATEIVQYVTQNAAACNWRSFNVVGHTDTSGSNAYNLGLSQRRADAVAGLMSAQGISQSAISTSAKGEEEPRVPTADGVRELQNRRVEILVNN
ncbi:OmpA family protein [Qipengyuania soli]|uniref:OmpA family protein n=1 Tax=Qipengyuania soli TaxID=2782568 RepID=A0A7S8IWD6_9SPHN|nr:OmpA family protein [Qipengyuania soli]QPD00561.1 OmpA family protein [Qipengyuania soli]